AHGGSAQYGEGGRRGSRAGICEARQRPFAGRFPTRDAAARRAQGRETDAASEGAAGGRRGGDRRGGRAAVGEMEWAQYDSECGAVGWASWPVHCSEAEENGGGQ